MDRADALEKALQDAESKAAREHARAQTELEREKNGRRTAETIGQAATRRAEMEQAQRAEIEEALSIQKQKARDSIERAEQDMCVKMQELEEQVADKLKKLADTWREKLAEEKSAAVRAEMEAASAETALRAAESAVRAAEDGAEERVRLAQQKQHEAEDTLTQLEMQYDLQQCTNDAYREETKRTARLLRDADTVKHSLTQRCRQLEAVAVNLKQSLLHEEDSGARLLASESRYVLYAIALIS